MSLSQLFSGGKPEVSETHRHWEKAKRGFFKAIKSGNLQQIDQIIADYPDALNRWENDKGLASLHVALDAGNEKSFMHLLDRGANVNQESEYKDPEYAILNLRKKYTIFSRAAYDGNRRLCYALIERGCNTYMKNLEPRGWHKKEIQGYIERRDEIREEYLNRQKGVLPALPASSVPLQAPIKDASKELEELKTKYNQLAKRLDDTEKLLQETIERIDRTERVERRTLDKPAPDAGGM